MRSAQHSPARWPPFCRCENDKSALDTKAPQLLVKPVTLASPGAQTPKLQLANFTFGQWPNLAHHVRRTCHA